MPIPATQTGKQLDSLLMETVRRSERPISFPTLLETLHEKEGEIDDREVRHVLWRLIDERRLILNPERLIELAVS